MVPISITKAEGCTTGIKAKRLRTSERRLLNYVNLKTSKTNIPKKRCLIVMTTVASTSEDICSTITFLFSPKMAKDDDMSP